MPGEQSRIGFELYLLAGLFLLTATFGRTFSKLELGFSWLHPTEVALAMVVAIALVRTPAREWIKRVRRTDAWIPLLVLWLFGALATLRGLSDWGFTLVLYDIGLVEYSLLVPLLAVVIRTRFEFLWLCGVLALGGILAMLAQAATLWTPLNWDIAGALNLILGASGMYVGVYVAWPLARRAAGISVAPWHYPVAVLGVALIILGLARAAWVGLLAALLIVVVASLPGRRFTSAALVVAVVALGVAVSVPAERVQFGEAPDAEASAPEQTARATDGAESDQAGAGGSSAAEEVTASFESSSQSGNARWRLAFWEYMVTESIRQPLGVGFGSPANFQWSGISYDSRTGDPADPFDVSGPHNSFLNMLYRMGIPGFLAVVAILVMAVFRPAALAMRTSGEHKAIAIWLLAALAVTSAAASLSVALEGPFMGIFFWAVVGLCLLAPQFLRSQSAIESTG